MRLKLTKFLKAPTTSKIHKIIHYLSLAVLVVGGIFYTYFLYEDISWQLFFPSGSKLQSPMWLMHISLRICCLWMPMFMLLVRWDPQPIFVPIVYIIGCVIAIIFSITASALIYGYKNPGEIKKEYSKLVQESIKSHNALPGSVVHGAGSYNCCGWYGSIDFGVSFDISDKVSTDLVFMKQVQECYGNTFEVTQSPGSKSLDYKRGFNTDFLDGCGPKYKKKAKTICYLISCAGIVIDLIGIVFIFLSVYNFINRSKRVQARSASSVISQMSDHARPSDSRPDRDSRIDNSLPPAPADEAQYVVRLPSRHSEL